MIKLQHKENSDKNKPEENNKCEAIDNSVTASNYTMFSSSCGREIVFALGFMFYRSLCHLYYLGLLNDVAVLKWGNRI